MDALIGGEFVVSCEIIPGRGAATPRQDEELAKAVAVWNTGLVHAISVTDNPGGHPALLAEAMGEELEPKAITSLVHFSCKDRSRNQILSQLYAMERKGLANILVMTGDYPAGGWKGRSRPVFDLDSVQLLMMIGEMNAGLMAQASPSGAKEQPSSFYAGAVVNPYKYTEGEVIAQYAKLHKKLFAGARYLITQLGYDNRKLVELQNHMRELGYETPVIASVFVLSYRIALLMREGMIAGCYVSDELLTLLAKEAEGRDGGAAAQIERAAQMVAVAKGMGLAGVHLSGLELSAEMVAQILSRAHDLETQWQDLFEVNCFGEPDGFYYYQIDGAADKPDQESRIPSPRNEQVKARPIMQAYRLSRVFNRVMLTPNRGFYGALKRSMEKREQKKGMRQKHGFERMVKTLLYNCMDCGDCALETCAYRCPMSYCPKCQRNGPCGGSIKGWCEVYPDERYCLWYGAYHRLKKYGETDKLSLYITLPNNWDYFAASGWSNYTHERDNAARRIVMK